MQKRVFRRGSRNPAAVAGALLCWLSGLVTAVTLALPQLVPPQFWTFAGVNGVPTPSTGQRLFGIGLGFILAGAGFLLWRGAPYLGGKRIIVDDEGIECSDGEGWLRTTWNEVQELRVEGDRAANRRYTLVTGNGRFSFSAWQVDQADSLAILIQEKIGRR